MRMTPSMGMQMRGLPVRGPVLVLPHAAKEEFRKGEQFGSHVLEKLVDPTDEWAHALGIKPEGIHVSDQVP